MNQRNGDGRIEIRLMNEYGATILLWDFEGHTDGDELDLTDGLRTDLAKLRDRLQNELGANYHVTYEH
ncbi:hypothetical protein BH09ACT10_BH09ACT10_26200 [soil metagenome]